MVGVPNFDQLSTTSVMFSPVDHKREGKKKCSHKFLCNVAELPRYCWKDMLAGNCLYRRCNVQVQAFKMLPEKSRAFNFCSHRVIFQVFSEKQERNDSYFRDIALEALSAEGYLRVTAAHAWLVSWHFLSLLGVTAKLDERQWKTERGEVHLHWMFGKKLHIPSKKVERCAKAFSNQNCVKRASKPLLKVRWIDRQPLEIQIAKIGPMRRFFTH